METRRLSELFADKERITIKDGTFLITAPPDRAGGGAMTDNLPEPAAAGAAGSAGSGARAGSDAEKVSIPTGTGPDPVRVNLLALGDVGSTLLMGLRLTGRDVVGSIGICDLREETARRFEMEINQIQLPPGQGELPEVEIIPAAALFDCDVMIFCASKGVPPVGDTTGDVRMAQLADNARLAHSFGRQAVEAGFSGMVALVSDPVDPLCKAMLLAGLDSQQVQGYGLGVMNSRALYYAKRDPRFARFAAEGRVFGPHGQDLVVADSIARYDDRLSRELTRLTVEANMAVRELGFKPYIAPALSSGALSILATLRGQWQYSSVYFGSGKTGAFLGVRNRRTAAGIEVEDLPLPAELYERIEKAYDHLNQQEELLWNALY